MGKNKTGENRKIHTNYPNFWNNLRKIRGLTFPDIASHCGVAPGVVNDWFNGSEMPSFSRVQQICELFGIDNYRGYLEFQKINRVPYEDVKIKLSAEDYLYLTEHLPLLSTWELYYMIQIFGDSIGVEIQREIERRDVISRRWKSDFVVISGPAEMMEYLYTRLSFADYQKVSRMFNCGMSPLPFLYGKLKPEEYNRVSDYIKDGLYYVEV